MQKKQQKSPLQSLPGETKTDYEQTSLYSLCLNKKMFFIQTNLEKINIL